ncbi:MAG: flagellar filament capping protein FliD [Lachnospiraceae bacterium]
MPIRLSGMASGLDTDTIVKELVSAYSTKKDNIVKKQTKLEWTQDAWKSMNSKIYSFYSKSLSNMRLSSSYSKKTASISNSAVAKVTASNGAVDGSQSLKVKQLAKSGYLTGEVITDNDGNKLSSSSKLSDIKGLNDIANLGGFDVKAGDKTTSIQLSQDMTIGELVNKLKQAGVNASFDEKNQRFFISAKTSGADGDFAITAATSDSVDALKGLGIYAVTDAELAKYKADAQIDVDAAVAKAYEEQKEKYTDTATQKKALEKQEKELTAKQEKLTTQTEYQNFKNQFLAGLKFDSSEVPVLNEDGTPKLDEDGNPVTRTEYSYASDSESKADILNNIETTITNLEEQIKSYADRTDLTDDEKKTKASLENQLKAAKDVLKEIGSDTLAASDIKAIVDKNAEAYIKASEELSQTESKLSTVKDTLSSDANLEAYTANLNSEIDSRNAELEAKLQEYYTNLKSTAQMMVDQNASATNMATRIVGQDSEIELNGATFTSNTNSFDINGLTIQATAVTGDEAVTITIDSDIDGIYNMVKDFFNSYNELIKEMDVAYNAASAGSYEPLTDDEKDAMTDSEIEKWETKIKDSLLRKDNTLGTLSSTMKSVMSQAFEIGGTKYSLSSFGINTLGYFASAENEKGVYHIDGDEDDSDTSGKTDKLRSMIASDPDTVVEFFSKLSTELYTKLTDKMKSSTLSSAYTVYNDKQMKTQYNNYTKDIASWEDKIAAYEERYYKQFSAMEKALSSLNTQQSQLSGLFGQ